MEFDINKKKRYQLYVDFVFIFFDNVRNQRVSRSHIGFTAAIEQQTYSLTARPIALHNHQQAIMQKRKRLPKLTYLPCRYLYV